MNTKKIVAMTIALIMTTAMFAGCGNSVDHKDTEVSSTVETTIDKDVEKESDKKSETAEKTDATETADKEDSKETSNKAEKPNDNKAEVNKSDKDKAEANKSDKDKGSANNSNSSVSKPNSGNANNNGSASKPSTPAKPNKPSSGNNSGSSNNGNHNGSVNKPSKPAEKPSEPQKPAPHVHNYNTVVSSTNGDCSHVGKVTKKCSCGATVIENGSYGDHSWQDQYKEVHHDAKYEDRPVYKWVAYDKCRKCGYETDHNTGDMIDHVFECGGTYTTLEKKIQTGTESVQVEKPWTERVPDGKKCTICGTHQ